MMEKIKNILQKRKRNCLAPINQVSAAVLIPLFYKDNELHILFTKRSDKVEHHKGEISFPGGTLDDSDHDLLECALRECEEEIGLQRKDVHIVGVLDDFPTRKTRFMVTPYVGEIPYPYSFNICKEEIEEIIPVPISVLLDKSNIEQKPVLGLDQKTYIMDFYYYNDHCIWGATGLMLSQFLSLVYNDQS